MGRLLRLGSVLGVLAVTACSVPRTNEYYVHRDLAIKDVLEHCTSLEEPYSASKEVVGSVRELALNYVELRHMFNVCKLSSEEVVALIGARSES